MNKKYLYIFLIVVFISFPLSCKKEPKVQPLWFSKNLSTTGTLKRALTLFPPNTKAYFVINAKALKKDTELTSIMDVVGNNLPGSKEQKKQLPLNFKSIFDLSLDLMVVGLVKNPSGQSIIALAIGNFNTLDIVQTLQQAVSDSGDKLVTTRKKEITLYTLAEEPLWGVVVASKELIILGNTSHLISIADHYLFKKKPDILSHPFTVKETSDPLFAWVKPGMRESDQDIQEIWVNVHKDQVWRANISLITANEEKAATVSEFLKANQIIAGNYKGKGAKLFKLFVKADLSLDKNKVTLSWPLSDIPWKDLMKEFAKTPGGGF